MDWTPEQIAELKRLNEMGLSYRQIANALGRTRNATIGSANRLGLCTPTERRPRPAPTERRPRRRNNGLSDAEIAFRIRSRPIPRSMSLLPKGKIQSKRVGFMEWEPSLECAAILDDSEPGGVRCGNRTHKAVNSKSWCYSHYRIFFP